MISHWYSKKCICARQTQVHIRILKEFIAWFKRMNQRSGTTDINEHILFSIDHWLLIADASRPASVANLNFSLHASPKKRRISWRTEKCPETVGLVICTLLSISCTPWSVIKSDARLCTRISWTSSRQVYSIHIDRGGHLVDVNDRIIYVWNAIGDWWINSLGRCAFPEHITFVHVTMVWLKLEESTRRRSVRRSEMASCIVMLSTNRWLSVVFRSNDDHQRIGGCLSFLLVVLWFSSAF